LVSWSGGSRLTVKLGHSNHKAKVSTNQLQCSVTCREDYDYNVTFAVDMAVFKYVKQETDILLV